MATRPVAPILEVRHLQVVYQDAIVALGGVSLAVPAGGIVALLGANGAGKTSLLRAVSGLLPVHGGKVRGGEVYLERNLVTRCDPAQLVSRGMAQVMEGRRLFAPLSVDENLRLGAFTCRDRSQVKASYERVMALFPQLAQRRGVRAGYLSGGEQQMLAIGRALMSSPRLLLLDEPSLGLAPQLMEQIKALLIDINRQGTSVLLVEQNLVMALSVAGWAYVLEAGKVTKSAPGPQVLAHGGIAASYLGEAASRGGAGDSREAGG